MATLPMHDAPESRRPWQTAGRLRAASLVWLVALFAAAIAALARGIPAATLAPYVVAATLPALIGLALSPWMRRNWAQLLVILAWLSLAIVACLALGFLPMAILFLTAPAAAALFEREKVIEALVLSALFAAAIYFVGTRDLVPDAGLGEAGARWGTKAGIVATVMFLVTAMMYAASARDSGPRAPRMTNLSRADLLAAVDGPVLLVDAEDRVDYASREALSTFGLPSDFGVMPTRALLATDPNAAQALRELIGYTRRTSTRQSRRIVTTDADDRVQQLNVTVSPLSGADNRGRLLLQARDVSDRLAEMERLRRERASLEHRAESTPDRSLFSAGVAHELRTPLNAIIGFSDMMRSRMFGPLPGRYAEYADLIHDSGQHMLDLIGDVLDLSKVEAGAYQLTYDIFDAGDVVRSSAAMVRPMADTAEVALVLDVPEDDVLVEADRRAVRQILLNLLSNAIKFSPKGAQIELALQAFDEDIVISVEDAGPGMSEDEIARIGEPFAQGASARLTEERGSGLGLALVSSLTELHDGSFEIESEGEGTLVSVTLPRKRAL